MRRAVRKMPRQNIKHPTKEIRRGLVLSCKKPPMRFPRTKPKIIKEDTMLAERAFQPKCSVTALLKTLHR